MDSRLTARTPGKLIVSGEHSVLYGAPALAMAVNRYTETTARWHPKSAIHFKFLDLAYVKTRSWRALRGIGSQLQRDYHAFLRGECPIRTVLKRPFELLQYAVAHFIEHSNVSLPGGLEIHVNSSIPMGCGMGSSASAIMSLLHALVHFLKLDWQLKDYLDFGRQAENLQHGRSSGIDLHLVACGGCVRFESGVVQRREVGNWPLYLVNTGRPHSSTGECVSHAAKHFSPSKGRGLGQAFRAVTEAVDTALQTQDSGAFESAVRENHDLLVRLGVVPEPVCRFITAVEAQGAAAKICGAGACFGPAAGVVLMSGEALTLQALAARHGYVLQKIQVDTEGTSVVRHASAG